MFINVFTAPNLHQRSRTGIDYPYIFPGKEIEDKIPTVSVSNFSEIDGGPYPASSQGPIHVVSNATTWVKGRHTFKGGVIVEYSGEDDFDQINVQAVPGGTNNQNGRFEFRDTRAGGTGLAISDMALGLFSNYAELGERAFTKWRSLGIDIFVQDSWKPRSDLTIEGGVRWACGHRGTRRRTISRTSTRDSTTVQSRRSSIRRPAGSPAVLATTASSCRATASRVKETIS